MFIALGHLRVRIRQSLVTVLSVSLGAMILVVTLAMMEGLLEDFKNKLLEASPPISVETNPETGVKSVIPGERPALLELRRGGVPDDPDEISRYPALEVLIKSIAGVKQVAPRACTPVVMYHGTSSERSLVCGIEPEKEKDVTRLWRWMRQGSMEDLGVSSGNIVLGRFLASHLSAELGSRVRVVSPSGVVMDLRVVGVFASGVTRIDDRQSFIRLTEGRRLAGIGSGSVTGVGVGVDSLDQSETIARKIEQMSGHKALTWEEANESAIGAFRMMGFSTYILVIFTAVVGGFGILNIMVTIVMEKVKDIALLRSFGYSASQVLEIFFVEALILGTVGGLIGCALGFVLSSLLNNMPMATSESASFQRETMGMLQDPWFYVIAFVISLSISIIAGVAPARRAARVDPVAVLRGER